MINIDKRNLKTKPLKGNDLPKTIIVNTDSFPNFKRGERLQLINNNYKKTNPNNHTNGVIPADLFRMNRHLFRTDIKKCAIIFKELDKNGDPNICVAIGHPVQKVVSRFSTKGLINDEKSLERWFEAFIESIRHDLGMSNGFKDFLLSDQTGDKSE